MNSELNYQFMEGVPEPCIGAPLPIIISDEGRLIVCFYAASGAFGPRRLWEHDLNRRDPDPVVRVIFTGVFKYETGAHLDEENTTHRAVAFFDHHDRVGAVEQVYPQLKAPRRKFFIPFHDSGLEVIASDYEAERAPARDVYSAAVGALERFG